MGRVEGHVKSTETVDGRKLKIVKNDGILRIEASILKSQNQADASKLPLLPK